MSLRIPEGLFDSTVVSGYLVSEIAICFSYATNGIHAFVVVLTGRTRFSKEEVGVVLASLLGEKFMTILLLPSRVAMSLGISPSMIICLPLDPNI